jgi:hypothetical protein
LAAFAQPWDIAEEGIVITSYLEIMKSFYNFMPTTTISSSISPLYAFFSKSFGSGRTILSWPAGLLISCNNVKHIVACIYARKYRR